MRNITRDEAQRLIESRNDLTVVEVLDPNEFERFHLPGARNVPLDERFRQNIQQTAPDRNKPVLVYCLNANCQAAPKAGQIMDELGYKEVLEYRAGKADWKDAGLPVEI